MDKAGGLVIVDGIFWDRAERHAQRALDAHSGRGLMSRLNFLIALSDLVELLGGCPDTGWCFRYEFAKTIAAMAADRRELKERLRAKRSGG